MYSRLPAPYGNWDKKEMKYAIGLFPLVGAVIGAMSWIWMWGMQRIMTAGSAGLPDAVLPAGNTGLPGAVLPAGNAGLSGAVLPAGNTGLPGVVLLAVSTLIAAILPVLVTGGIHVDGFMDSSDAMQSWAEKDKKLQILSDPHIGAFSVINLLILSAFWLSAVAVVVGSGDERYFGVFALEYVLARALSGLAAVLFVNARGEGTLWAFTDFGDAARRTNLVLLSAQGLAAAAFMILLKPAGGCAAVIISVFFWASYRRRAYEEFGGITGDLEGWFLCKCEVLAACALAVVCICGF